eukprot:m.248446 g.248446  ORF g.248446 m.248446 type:complete len:393 (-) comp10972_c1_seq1:679-1857(-)
MSSSVQSRHPSHEHCPAQMSFCRWCGEWPLMSTTCPAAPAALLHFRRPRAKQQLLPDLHITGFAGPEEAAHVMRTAQNMAKNSLQLAIPHPSHVVLMLASPEAAAALCRDLLDMHPQLAVSFTECLERAATATVASNKTPRSAPAQRELNGRDTVPGAHLEPDFLDSAEEAALLAELAGAPHWHRLSKRRVLQYGTAFDYATRIASRTDEAAPFSPQLEQLATRLSACGVAGTTGAALYDQLTVNEYPVGSGIGAHIDTHSAFGPSIAVVSLGSSCSMIFRAALARSSQEKDSRFFKLFLPRRSLLILSGESRYAWTHAIPFVSNDVTADDDVCHKRGIRTSLTFRSLLREGHRCCCDFPSLCDSQDAPAPLDKPTRAQERHLRLQQMANLA